MSKRFYWIGSLLFTLFGILLTLSIAEAHIQGFVDSLCPACSIVLNSPLGEIFGFPTALYGFVLFYTLLIGLIAYPFFEDEVQRNFLSLSAGAFFLANVIFVGLTLYSKVVLDTFCPLCLLSFAVTLLTFITLSTWRWSY